MFIDAIERLYAYQRESNNPLFKVASAISAHDFTGVIVDGQPSIRVTLFHMIEVIETHFAWWSFAEDGIYPKLKERDSRDFKDSESIQKYWESIDDEVSKCVESITSDDQLNRPYKRAFADGSSNTRILWEMMLHVTNHGTQHRSEVAMMLTKLEHSPGDMEIL